MQKLQTFLQNLCCGYMLKINLTRKYKVDLIGIEKCFNLGYTNRFYREHILY